MAFLIKLKLFFKGETMPTDEETLKNVDEFIEDSKNELQNNDDPIFQRDKFILDMMIHAYEEDERRNTLVDSKNSQMIAILGVMLTIQGSLFTFLLSNFATINFPVMNVILSVLALVSLGYYVYSMKIFVDAYYFKTFKSIPNHEYLIKSAKENVHEHNIVGDLIGSFGDAINYNKEVIFGKVNTAKEGFKYFKKGGLCTVLFVLVFLLSMLSL